MALSKEELLQALIRCLDEELRLAVALDTPGLVGNTQLKQSLHERLKGEGLSEAEWSEVHSRAARNQNFLTHSLRNLDVLFGHLRRCMGEVETYSPTGQIVDKTSAGKVLEVSY